MKDKKALVVFSGGQDSTTCLFWAIREFGGANNVTAMTFDYGQKHNIELESAKKVAEIAGVMQFVVEVSSLKQLGGNALTDNAIPVMKGSADDGIPDTFVPGRNLIFMTLAAAWAWPRNIRHLVTGVAQTDYSGYPDCRADTLQALNQSINLGMETNFQIHTPLMNLSKAETVTLAMECSAMEAMKYSHTCYNGEFPPCGTCPSCILRAKGFKEAGIIDPLFTR